MLFIVNLDDTPRVRSSTDVASIGRLHALVGANNGEWDLSSNLFRLCDSLFILILVGRSLEDMDVVVCNIGQNLHECVDELTAPVYCDRDSYPSLEFGNLIVREGIGLRDHGNEIDLGMEPAHELDVQGLQAE